MTVWSCGTSFSIFFRRLQAVKSILLSKSAAKIQQFFDICKNLMVKMKFLCIFSIQLYFAHYLISIRSPPCSNGCSMDDERVLNGCSNLASSIVTLTKSLYLLKKICDRLFSSKSGAKIILFSQISKFFTTKISFFFIFLHMSFFCCTFAPAKVEKWKRK